MQVGRGRNLRAHPSVRTSRVCRNPKSDTIYMIMPRYSHNYAFFYQLLESNLFTHRNTYTILREASSETYGPRVYLLSYTLSIYFYLHLYFLHLYYKIPKIYLSYHTIFIRSHSASGREGIDNPFIALVACSLFVCVGSWDLLRSLLLD